MLTSEPDRGQRMDLSSSEQAALTALRAGTAQSWDLKVLDGLYRRANVLGDLKLVRELDCYRDGGSPPEREVQPPRAKADVVPPVDLANPFDPSIDYAGRARQEQQQGEQVRRSSKSKHVRSADIDHVIARQRDAIIKDPQRRPRKHAWEPQNWAMAQRLDPLAKAVLMVVANHVDADGQAHPLSVKRIAAESGLSRRTVLDRIQGLQRDGLLAVVRKWGAKGEKPGQRASAYVIPFWRDAEPS